MEGLVLIKMAIIIAFVEMALQGFTVKQVSVHIIFDSLFFLSPLFLKNSTLCKNLCTESCFKKIVLASTYHNLKIT